MHFAGVCTDPDPRQATVISNFGISAAVVISSPATTAAATKGTLNRNMTSSQTRLSPRTSGPILYGSAQPSSWTWVHVRFGSKADICSAKRHVRFTPESGHRGSPEQAQKPVPYANSVSQRGGKPERELREKQNEAKPYQLQNHELHHAGVDVAELPLRHDALEKIGR